MHDIEDLNKEETTVFNPAQWIGCGHKFQDVPHYVCNVLNSLRKTPDKEYCKRPSNSVKKSKPRDIGVWGVGIKDELYDFTRWMGKAMWLQLVCCTLVRTRNPIARFSVMNRNNSILITIFDH